MQVQLNTDSHVQGRDSLADWLRQEVTHKLSRHQDLVTRVGVHLSDLNAGRIGGDDKRCLIEARLAGRPPLAVDHQADKVADAVQGALDKLVRALDSTLGRTRDANRRDSIRGDTP